MDEPGGASNAGRWRILSMADVSPDPHSGAAGTVLSLTEALAGLGHEVDTVWASDLSHRVRHGNLHYLLELPLTYRAGLRRRLAGGKYDVVQVSQPHGYLAARAARSVNGLAFIHVSHGLEPRRADVTRRWETVYPRMENDPGRRRSLLSRILAHLLRRHDRSIARHADGHLVGCSDCAAYLRDEMGVSDSRVEVIYRGVPESMHREPTRPMSPERLAQVLHVGQFAYFKAPMIVAEVMSQLATRDETLRFTWVTSRAHHDRVRSLLDQRARDRVRLLDWMPQDELIDVLDHHGVFLFPSFFEGFGKAFLEAMARGLCVVAADNSGAHDVITDGVDGRLVETGVVEKMTRACADITQDPEAAMRMSNEAVRTARGYTWSRVAQRVEAFYSRCLGDIRD